MRRTIFYPHTADIRIKIEADSLEELFEEALFSMGNILKEDFCSNSKKYSLSRSLRIKSSDITALLIDFLSEALTASYENTAVFCQAEIKHINTKSIEVIIKGNSVVGFDEDIKAVTYHEAEVRKNKKGIWETRIIFDI